MTTLCLNVPKDKADGEGKKSYADTLNSAVGSGYGIPMSQAMKCVPGFMKCVPGFIVVLLCQMTGQRAEGRIKALKMTGEATGSGIVRYDIYMEDLAAISYHPAPAHFGHTGVLVVAR